MGYIGYLGNRIIIVKTFYWKCLFPTKVGLWFEFHYALNMLAILLTIFVFSIAIYVVGQNPNAHQFDTFPHKKVGLAIFLLCSFVRSTRMPASGVQSSGPFPRSHCNV
jgi:ribose/xylose/arabinose/galactoside ABC-type transport system permease subunit